MLPSVDKVIESAKLLALQSKDAIINDIFFIIILFVINDDLIILGMAS